MVKCFDTCVHCLYARVCLCLGASLWAPAIHCVFKCEPCARCWLSSSQVEAVCGLLSPVLHHCSSPLLSQNLTAVSCHSLMDAPGSNNNSLQPFITATSLSEPSRSNLLHRRSPVTLSLLTFVLYGARGNVYVCMSKKTTKRVKEEDRMTERRWKRNNKMSRELPCEQM